MNPMINPSTTQTLPNNTGEDIFTINNYVIIRRPQTQNKFLAPALLSSGSSLFQQVRGGRQVLRIKNKFPPQIQTAQ